MTPRIRHFLRYWLPVVGYCLLIYIQSSGALPVHLPRVRNFDKLLHFGGYALLGALAFRAIAHTPSAGGLRWAFFFSMVLVALYGASDELHQAFVPRRSADPLDFLSDLAGGAAGAWLFRCFAPTGGSGGSAVENPIIDKEL